MSKIYLYYGSMNCGKSLHLLSNVHNYEGQGKNVLLLKPSFDTRNPAGEISSRIGISHSAIEFDKYDNLYQIVFDYMIDNAVSLDCIFVDEVHFSTTKQIKELVDICDILNINIICYGLKNSYVESELFEPIKILIYQANSIMEIKSTCTYCNSKATHHLRVVSGKVIRSGQQNIVGDIAEGDEQYISVCRKHYYSPPFEKIK